MSQSAKLALKKQFIGTHLPRLSWNEALLRTVLLRRAKCLECTQKGVVEMVHVALNVSVGVGMYVIRAACMLVAVMADRSWRSSETGR